jgi:hypothetical protein
VSVSCARCGVEGERGEQPGEGRIVHGGGETLLGEHRADLLCDDCAEELLASATRHITLGQIRGLRDAAAEAGDILQMAICDVALESGAEALTQAQIAADERDYSGGGMRREDQRRINGMDQAEALAECARVLMVRE